MFFKGCRQRKVMFPSSFHSELLVSHELKPCYIRTNGVWPIWYNVRIYKSPDSILQSVQAGQLDCPLAGTPGVLVPCQRRWSSNRESIFTKTRDTEKLHWKPRYFQICCLNFIYEGICPVVCRSRLSWVKRCASLNWGK